MTSSLHLAHRSKAVWRTVKQHPSVLLVPLLTLVVLLGVSLFGVLWTAKIEEENNKDAARSDGWEELDQLLEEIEGALLPVLHLATMVKLQPYHPTLMDNWDMIGQSLMGEGELAEHSTLVLVPSGYLSALYPPDISIEDVPIGADLMSSSRPTVSAMYNYALQQKENLTIIGPRFSVLAQQHMLVLIQPVYAKASSSSETFGFNRSINNVPHQLLYDATTRHKLWGFVTSAMYLGGLMEGEDSRLTHISDAGYRYRLVAQSNGALLAQSDPPPRDPVEVQIEMMGIQWQLLIAPAAWTPEWRDGVLALVVVCSTLLSALLFVAMLSWQQYKSLLEAMLPKAMIHELQEASTTALLGERVVTGTPADTILSMLGALLQGVTPPLPDIVLVRTAILRSYDIYQPLNLKRQMQGANLDLDVTRALIQQLGTGNRDMGSSSDIGGHMAGGPGTSELLHSVAGSMVAEAPATFHGLGEALACIMAKDGALLLTDMEVEDEGGGRPLTGHAQLDSRQASLDVSARPSLARGSFLMSSPGGTGSCTPGGGGGGRSSPPPSTPQQPSSSRPPSGDCWAREALGLRPVAAPVMEVVEQVLAGVDEWQYDSFRLYEASGGHPLSTLAYFLFHKAGLITTFKINPVKLARYMRRIESGYCLTPYHSHIHAADVLRSMHILVTRGGLMPGYVDSFTLMACYFVAAVHDYEHQGLTNDFLVASSDSLALLYNDRSPLENHHVSAAFALLRRPSMNFLPSMPSSQMGRFRKMAIDMVMATDMKQHFAILSHFRNVHRLSEGPAQAAGAEGADGPAGDGQQPPADAADAVRMPVDEAERLLSLQMALKCADLGHLAADLPVHERWVQCLEEEFFRQGDREAASGMPISPLFDRSKQGVTKSQVGFFDFVAAPLFTAFCRVFPCLAPVQQQVMRNYRHWVQLERQKAPAEAGGSPKQSTSGAAAPQPANQPSQAQLSGPAEKPGHTTTLITVTAANGAVAASATVPSLVNETASPLPTRPQRSLSLSAPALSLVNGTEEGEGEDEASKADRPQQLGWLAKSKSPLALMVDAAGQHAVNGKGAGH